MERFTIEQSNEKKMEYMRSALYFVSEYFNIKNSISFETDALKVFGEEINEYSKASREILIFDQSNCYYMDELRKRVNKAFDKVLEELDA